MKYLKINCLEITPQVKKSREDLQAKIAGLISEQKLFEASITTEMLQLISEDEQSSLGISDKDFNLVDFSNDIECVVVDPKIYSNA